MDKKPSSLRVTHEDRRAKIEWFDGENGSTVTLYVDKLYTLPDKEKGA